MDKKQKSMFIKPQTIKQQVKAFKQQIKAEMKEQKIEKLEVAITSLYELFNIEMRSKQSSYWFPKRYTNEFKEQGIIILKRRGYKTVFIEVESD